MPRSSSSALSTVGLGRLPRRLLCFAVLLGSLLFASPATATPIVLNFNNFFTGGCEEFVQIPGFGTACELYRFSNGMTATGTPGFGFFSPALIVNDNGQRLLLIESPNPFDLVSLSGGSGFPLGAVPYVITSSAGGSLVFHPPIEPGSPGGCAPFGFTHQFSGPEWQDILWFRIEAYRGVHPCMSSSHSFRLREFTIVPEPPVVVLLALAGFALILQRARRHIRV